MFPCKLGLQSFSSSRPLEERLYLYPRCGAYEIVSLIHSVSGRLCINKHKPTRYKTAATVLLRAWSQLFLKFSVNSAEVYKPQPCLSSWQNCRAMCWYSICISFIFLFGCSFIVTSWLELKSSNNLSTINMLIPLKLVNAPNSLQMVLKE